MNKRAQKPCTYPMCPNLTTGRYCSEHAHKAEQERAERHRHYDRHQRDQQAAGFYKSQAWERIRQQALIRDHGLCQYCLKENQVKTADMVHHIKPVRTHRDLRLVLSNLISLCNSCHAKIDHSKL